MSTSLNWLWIELADNSLCCVWVLQLLSGCLHCDCHLSMARLFDRFYADREKWSSYLMRAEFYFDSNNITTDRKKKAALCSTMSPETFALLRIYWPRKWQMFRMKKWKLRLKIISKKIRNFLAARLYFFGTVQQEGQYITDFLAELRNNAKECDFEEQYWVNWLYAHFYIVGNTEIKRRFTDERPTVSQNSRTTQKRAVQNAQTTDHTTGHTKQEAHAVRYSQPSRKMQRFRDKQRSRWKGSG